MHARTVATKHGPITIRPLRSGDTATVQTVFARLGEQSRRLRFGGAKQILTADELERLARVDDRHEVLVAYSESGPVGIAHLVRDDHGASAEIAWAVADAWQRLGIGTAFARLLSADAAAAGITELRATMHVENRASFSLMRKATRIVSRCIEGGELHVVGLTG